MISRVGLKEAIRFHGHLGPYLVLGILAGEFALKKLKCKKYFNLTVKVWGTNKKPKSCLIDGLQLSSGATYGKGNIIKCNGQAIKIEFKNKESKKKLTLRLRDNIIRDLRKAKRHQDSELLANKLYYTDQQNLFNLTPNT